MSERVRFVATKVIHRDDGAEPTDWRIRWTECGKRYCPDGTLPRLSRAAMDASPKCKECYP